MTVAVIVAVLAVVYYCGGNTTALTGDNGLGLPSANEWFAGAPGLGFALSLVANGATVVVMLLLNKVFNVFRSMTSLFIALYAVMQLATPSLLTQFYTGTLLAVVVPLCMFLLFGCYRQPDSTHRIFLIAFILSGLTATQYCYAFYLLPFFVGCWQMSILSRRTVAAALMGIATPWILYLGYGIIDTSGLQWPRFGGIFSEIDLDDTMLLLASIGFTVFLTLLCYILNVFKTIAYNARARAVNGAFTVVTLVTVVAMCVDYRNIVGYVPMLNYCAAMEVTHYFSTHRAEKTYIAILLILAAYVAFYICQTVI